MGQDSPFKGVRQVGQDVDCPQDARFVEQLEISSPESVLGEARLINPSIGGHEFSAEGTRKCKQGYRDIEEELLDQDYNTFLKYAKNIGKAYAYKSDVPDKRLDYDVVHIANDELYHKNSKILKDTSPEYNVKTRRAQNEERGECMKNSNSTLCKRKRSFADEQLKEKAAELNQARHGNNGKRIKVGFEGKDYKSKLRSQSLKKVFPVKEPNHQPVQPSTERKNCRKSNASMQIRCLADREVKGKAHEFGQLNIPNIKKRKGVCNQGKDYKSKLISHSLNEEKRQLHLKKMKHEALQPSSGRTSRSSGHKKTLEVPSSPKPKGGHKQESEPSDKDYMKFLDWSIVYNDVLLKLKLESGRTILYFDVSDSFDSSDSNSIIMADCPDQLNGGRDSFIVSKVHHSAENDKKRSQFRTLLIVKLHSPYDFNEYKFLLKKASERMPVKQHKELRSGAKSYAFLESTGKSYLDHYKDLAAKIDSISEDRPRVLNLLRGFFYWLENLLCEGAVKPWNDKECLKILPRS